MAKGRMTHDWDMASLLWATLSNTVRDPKQKPEPFMPEDVHPLRTAASKQQTAPFDSLKILVSQHNANR